MKRILLIDDDDSFRKMLRLTLQRNGFEIIEARDGDEGIRLYNEQPVDLILTDLIMPEKEGLETIKHFRLNHADAKIIAMSGGGRISATDFLNIANKMGANGTLHKPFATEEILKMINEVLNP